jgi:Fe-S oxidoreductase
MHYNPFVLPFTIGLGFLLVMVVYRFVHWIYKLPYADRKKFWMGLITQKIFFAAKEIFLESLIHRKIFRINPLLGYMHMTIAFGWLLLIIVGNMESRLHAGIEINPPYYPIFLRYFVHDHSGIPYGEFFANLMDFLLLFVLSGVILAYIKRAFSFVFGVKRKPRRKIQDIVIMITLWTIFPLRLFAESFTASVYGNGGFITGTIGSVMSYLPHTNEIAYTFWWLYSISLGTFFVVLPFTRYMHIPAEVLLIFMRNSGIKTEKEFTSYSELEVYSCPKCGMCMDKCQMGFAANIKDMQSVYFIQSIRNHKIEEKKLFNCMICGRCQEFCPVGIDLNAQRMIQRKYITNFASSTFDYLPSKLIPTVEVLYFAGCMTHLTPGIKKSMIAIFKQAKINYNFMDADGTVCCGRPLMLTGKEIEAKQLINKNEETIRNSGAKLLVTSCPICFKVFKEEYALNIEIIHHSQYLLKLVEEGKIILSQSEIKAVFHDPCELGRGSGVYDEPRKLLGKTVQLQEIKNSKEASLCCGGSLGNTQMISFKRDMISADACKKLLKDDPELLVTACPLCKKSLGKFSTVEIKDIAEIVADNMDYLVSKNDKEKNVLV